MDTFLQVLGVVPGAPIIAMFLIMPFAMGKAMVEEVRGHLGYTSPQALVEFVLPDNFAREAETDPAFRLPEPITSPAWMADDAEPEFSVNEVFIRKP